MSITSPFNFLLCTCILALFACTDQQELLANTNPDEPHSQHSSNKTLVFSDDFTDGLNSNHWIAEVDPQPNSLASAIDGRLIIDTAGGATLWLNKLLQGDIEIVYNRIVVQDTGVNDRVSDMNQFWMAQELGSKPLSRRKGRFEEYSNLSLYYAGIGGNTNTTTRFRKYSGTGKRELLQEYSDPSHLLKANHEYTIRITVIDNTTQLFVDNELYFSYSDARPLRRGYFGIRSTASRHSIDNIKIYQLTGH